MKESCAGCLWHSVASTQHRSCFGIITHVLNFALPVHKFEPKITDGKPRLLLDNRV